MRNRQRQQALYAQRRRLREECQRLHGHAGPDHIAVIRDRQLATERQLLIMQRRLGGRT